MSKEVFAVMILRLIEAAKKRVRSSLIKETIIVKNVLNSELN